MSPLGTVLEHLGHARAYVRGLVLAVEAAAERKEDPLQRTAVDHLVAVLAVIAAFALVIGSICLGEARRVSCTSPQGGESSGPSRGGRAREGVWGCGATPLVQHPYSDGVCSWQCS
jgi:hypothetical protein